jgi:hypothetical protein
MSKNVDEAVKICLLTMTSKEKEEVKNTPEKDLILFHLGWAMNIRNEFGTWQGNDSLIRSCGAFKPDDASMPIVKAVWKELKSHPKHTI